MRAVICSGRAELFLVGLALSALFQSYIRFTVYGFKNLMMINYMAERQSLPELAVFMCAARCKNATLIYDHLKSKMYLTVCVHGLIVYNSSMHVMFTNIYI